MAALLATLVLMAGCQASTDSPAPTSVQSPKASASAQPSPTQASTPPSTPGAAGWRWDPAGTMAVGHSQGVLLADGRAMLLGTGRFGDFSDDTSMAELWDPATGAWQTIESLPSPRADFATVALADGRVLVTGGRNLNDQSFSSTYVYDPRAGHGSWVKVGLLHTARTAPMAAALADGRVLVAGGYFRVKPNYGADAGGGTVLAAYRRDSLMRAGSLGPRLADVEPPNVGSALATAEIFDPATGTWAATGPLKYARLGAQTVRLADGRILIVGSDGGGGGVSRVDSRAFDSAEIYDPRTRRFSLAGRLPGINRSALEKQGTPGANPVPDGDPVVDNIGSLVALPDGGAILIAQAGSWKHQGDITRSFRFDARAATWTEIGHTFVVVGEPKPELLVTEGVLSRAGAMVAALPDGRVLVAGGAGAAALPYSNTYTSASTELYDPSTDAWSPLPPMPEPRAGGVVVVLQDGSVLLAGGYSERPSGESIVLTSAVRFVPTP